MVEKPQKIVFLFPGQGAEQVRMGLEWAKVYPPAEKWLQLASELSSYDLPRIIRRGGKAFSRTDVIQPAIAAVSLGVWSYLVEQDVQAHFVAGHSLGELVAWCASGCISPEQTLELAVLRGRLMQKTAERYPGGMLALVGCSREQMLEALEAARKHGVVGLAAHNAPEEWVLSGERSALEAVPHVAKLVPLKTSGPWHSPLMSEVYEPYLEALNKLPLQEYKIPFVANRLGTVVTESEQIPLLLAEQITRPVQWAKSLSTLEAEGATDIILVGLVKTLRGLLRKCQMGGVQVHPAEHPKNLKKLSSLFSPSIH